MAKYNTQIVDDICKKIEDGLSQKDSAVLCGITEETFYRWMKKVSFVSRVNKSLLKYKNKLIQIVNVKSTSEPTGRTALELLARRFPEEFSEKRKLELSGELNVIPILGGKSVNAISGDNSNSKDFSTS